MKTLLQLCVLLLAISPALAAADAVVVRTAVVYDKPGSGAKRVGKIAAGSEVDVFSRNGGWKEIFSEQESIIGWVRSYQVREGNYAPQVKTESSSDSRGFLSGLASLSRKASGFFKSGSGSTSSGTATIGVRGLSEEEIKSAQADFSELEKMKKYRSSSKRQKRFVKRGKLKANKVAYIKGSK